MSWKNSVCMSAGTFACPAVDDFVVEIDKNGLSAIDAFYATTTEIATKVTPDFFNQYGEDIAGLLFVGLISATENYFRDILGVILSICPISQIHSADEKIQLGSLLWGPKDLHNRTAFEFMAFSSAKNIKETFQKFTKHAIAQHGAWSSMLDEYDKLCEFRHAVVHSGHIIAGKNAVKLRLKPSRSVMKFQLSYALLQSAARVCTCFVQAANNELFEMLVQRWAVEWRKLPSWTQEQERLLKTVHESFLSKRDKKNKSIQNNKTYPSFLDEVKQQFSLT